jgi:photosystem II stability/assembly factor-like uncharacterized protein
MKRPFQPYLILSGAILLILINLSDRRASLMQPGPIHDEVPGTYRALTYMSAIRAYPEADIPPDGYTKAFNAVYSQLKSSHDYGTEWEQMGPWNVGGRTLDIALNPQNLNTIYAASASGGLWRSYTGGVGYDVWERVDIGYPALAIGAVEISPADTNILLVGTGECYGYGEYFPSVSYRATRGLNGMGILKSVDNGQTWYKSLDWSYNQNRGVQRIKFDPQDPQIVWAATTEGTYRSLDAGDTWTLANNVPMATDIAIIPENPDIVLIACGGMYSEDNGIYRTTNGGTSWNKCNMGSGGPTSFGGKARLAIAPSASNIIYASIGKSQSTGSSGTWLCKSTDYGETWLVASTQNYSDYQGWYSHFVAVSLDNPNKLFCGGIDMWQSSNGGTSLAVDNGQIYDWFDPDWLHSDHHDFELHPADADIIYFATDGGVFRTDDGGNNFYSCNWGYQTGQFYPGFSCSDTDSLLAMGGLQDNFSAVYEGDMEWLRVIGGDGSHTAINQQNNNILYGSYQYLNILKSNNQGGSFATITPNYTGNVNFIAPFVLSPVNSTTLYGATSNIYKSGNGGTSWSAVNTSTLFSNNPVLALGISSSSINVVYAATMPINPGPGIFKTTNGSEWEEITGANLPDRMPTDLHVDVNDHDIVYVTYGGFGSSHLFMTTDGGLNWMDIGQELPDIPGWSVTTDPEYPEHIYYGNEFGVFVSTDGGEHWEEFNEGLGDGAFVMDLKISMSNRKLRAATHGNGVYERALIGSAVGVKEAIPNTDVFNLKCYPNPFQTYTTVLFTLQDSGTTRTVIFDLSGKRVRSLYNGDLPVGEHRFFWDGTGDNGNKLPPGLYFIRIDQNTKFSTIKLQIL